MKKTKIILSSVAVLMVLVFCITIGVYAATSISFTITSTVSFQSPDINGVTIQCYVTGQGFDNVLQHTYSTNTDGSVTGASWDFSTVKNSNGNTVALTYSTRDSDDQYAPITLKFVIKHATPLNLYAYFTKVQTQGAEATYLNKDVLNGYKQTDLALIDVKMNDNISTGIAGKTEDQTAAEYEGGEVSIEFALKNDVTLINDSVNDIAYNLVVSKFAPTTE